MSVEFDRGSPGKFDSRTLNRKTLNRWTGRTAADTAAVLARLTSSASTCCCKTFTSFDSATTGENIIKPYHRIQPVFKVQSSIWKNGPSPWKI